LSEDIKYVQNIATFMNKLKVLFYNGMSLCWSYTLLCSGWFMQFVIIILF